MRNFRFGIILLLFVLSILLVACSDTEETAGGDDGASTDSTADSTDEADSEDKSPIKIGVLASLSGALEAYGEQTKRGFELGIEYATEGTNEIDGHPIEIIFKDTETKPEVAVQRAVSLLEEDKVDFLVGSSSSADTLAVVPLAEQYEKIMVVEPAVADTITGGNFNKYIFRTARNSSQDAIAAAAAIADDGVKIATLAPDYAFGIDGVAAFKEAAEGLGAEVVLEEYADPAATDFTANIQKIIDAEPDYLFVVWAGANTPWNQLQDMNVQDQGIKITTGAPDIAALKTMGAVIGMEGFTVYHYTLPDNEINDWLVGEHKKRFDGEVPDLFTPGGMSAAISVVKAINEAGVGASGEDYIKTMEGMSFDTPKGEMTFRREDHQAMQTLYHIELQEKDGFDYPVPVLIDELTPEQTAPPIRN